MSLSQELETKLRRLESQNSELKNQIRTLEEKLSAEAINVQSLEQRYTVLKNLVKRKDALSARLEKLSSVGQYVPEIIHKLKNPLMGISGYSELAEIAETKDEMLLQLAKIQPQVQKLSALLGQMRSMISHESEEFIAFDLNNNLVESLQILEIFKPKIFNLEHQFSENILMVKGDPYQLHQVHLNVAKIFFKTIVHDQNRVIKINTQPAALEQIQRDKLMECLQTQPSTYWAKIQKLGRSFALISYESNLIGIDEQNLTDIFLDKMETEKQDKQVRLCFDIIRDITRRHLGNFIVKKDTERTTFFLILPGSE